MAAVSGTDHLFISYATENTVFADWLARKLMSEGYKVWYDRLNLLGGESYPANIDIASCPETHPLARVSSRRPGYWQPRTEGSAPERPDSVLRGDSGRPFSKRSYRSGAGTPYRC